VAVAAVTLYPTDNAFDIPVLRLDRQATTIETPVMPWGAVSRGTRMAGTWVFYVDDSRFTALLRDPLQLLATGCTAAAEPNVTLHETSPRAEVLWALYRKRAAARAWQDAGVRVLVDLNVPRRFHDLALLGVPHGWTAYATRGYHLRLDDLDAELALSRTRSACPTLLVYGGGAKVEARCRERAGCIYVPDHMQRLRAVS
jgi:hypothetical protein